MEKNKSFVLFRKENTQQLPLKAELLTQRQLTCKLCEVGPAHGPEAVTGRGSSVSASMPEHVLLKQRAGTLDMSSQGSQ